MIELKILGKPKAQQRPRFTKQGHTYSPGLKEKNDMRVVIQDKAPKRPLDGPVVVHIVCYFARPKTHYGTGRNAGKLKTSSPTHHIQKPDIDNLFKFYTDAMSGIIYGDDKQIVKTVSAKAWTQDQPRTEIKVLPQN